MGFIYCLEFSNGKKYVGLTTKTVDSRYAEHKSSSKYQNQAIYHAWRKYGDPSVSTLAEVGNDILHDEEIRFIAEAGSLAPGGYNMTTGGDISPSLMPEVRKKISQALKGRKGTSPSAETRRLIGEKSRGHTLGEESRKKISIANTGSIRTPEQREKISAATTGRKLSNEHKEKVSLFHKGRVKSFDHQSKITAALTGRSMSQEQREKLSVIGRARIVTDETKAKIVAALTGRPVSEDTRKKIAETNRGKTRSPEAKKNMSIAQKARQDAVRRRTMP